MANDRYDGFGEGMGTAAMHPMAKRAMSEARTKALEAKKEGARKVPVKTNPNERMGFYHAADEKTGVKGHIKGETQYHHERAGKGYWSKDK